MKVPLPAHFDLADADAYARWREEKLARHPRRLEELMVELRDPRRITAVEREAILRACARANMAVYAGACGADPDKDIPRRLAAAIGLRRLDANYLADDDGITPLAVAQAGTRSGYIPYTNRGIRWHTDGYYNEFGREIRGMVLHCVMSASAGGENRLLDHEIAYILLRDRDPEFIAALMANDAMTIPARIEDVGGASREQGPRAAGMRAPASAAEPPTARAACTGPVFSVGPGGRLHMRYTARTRSIAWKEDERTRAAVAALEEILEADSPWVFRGRLEPGMGLACNNVLHDRAPFSDTPERRRLLYRARYFDRVAEPSC